MVLYGSPKRQMRIKTCKSIFWVWSKLFSYLFLTQKHMKKTMFCQNKLSKSPNSYFHFPLWASVVPLIKYLASSSQIVTRCAQIMKNLSNLFTCIFEKHFYLKSINRNSHYICFSLLLFIFYDCRPTRAPFVGSLAPQQGFDFASRCFIVKKKVCFVTCKVKTEDRVTLLLQFRMLIDHNGGLFSALPVKMSLLRCPTIFHVLLCSHSVQACAVSARTSRYRQTLVLLQHAKNLPTFPRCEKNQPSSPNCAVIPIIASVTAGEPLSAASRLMFF